MPLGLIINLEQTLLKYVPVLHHTITKKGANSVSVTVSADKRYITGTFLINLAGNFLPLQLIYGGKTIPSLPRFKSFSLSVNPKHFSNTEESIKIINEIVLSYIDKLREKLDNHGQAALLILDAVRGQMTLKVTILLLESNILFVTVPNNMTHFFQPLDLTVNGHCKSFMRREIY